MSEHVDNYWKLLNKVFVENKMPEKKKKLTKKDFQKALDNTTIFTDPVITKRRGFWAIDYASPRYSEAFITIGRTIEDSINWLKTAQEANVKIPSYDE